MYVINIITVLCRYIIVLLYRIQLTIDVNKGHSDQRILQSIIPHNKYYNYISYNSMPDKPVILDQGAPSFQIKHTQISTETKAELISHNQNLPRIT